MCWRHVPWEGAGQEEDAEKELVVALVCAALFPQVAYLSVQSAPTPRKAPVTPIWSAPVPPPPALPLLSPPSPPLAALQCWGWGPGVVVMYMSQASHAASRASSLLLSYVNQLMPSAPRLPPLSRASLLHALVEHDVAGAPGAAMQVTVDGRWMHRRHLRLRTPTLCLTQMQTHLRRGA